MDQLRTALAWLKEQHFWVLSVLVALIAIGCWWKASAKMDALYKTSEAAIKTEFTNVENVKKEPFHPNDDVNKNQAAQTKEQAEGVAKLWQQLYDRQRVEVLKWPSTLSAAFREYVEKLQFGAVIPPELRNNYQNYVEGHFPKLPQMVGARPLQATGSAAGPGSNRGFSPEGPGGPVMPDGLQDENDYICQWLDSDQAYIHDELIFASQPSPLRIWVTQEDLWVYETLLGVVKKTNEAAHASRMANAAVKAISELAVGRRAGAYSRTAGRLMVPPPIAAAAGPGPAGAAPGPTGAAAGPESGGPGARTEMGPTGGANGQMSEAQEQAVLLSGRYLDAQGKPIPFGGAGGAAPDPGTATTPDPAAAAPPLDLTVFGQEYKRLPVRMVLRMDQRWLPQLIAQCASEPLQVEVQEVHITAADTHTAGGGPGGGPRGFEGGGPNATSSFPEESGPQPFPAHPEIVDVIIQGTIYIFNKPNPTVLQTGDQPLAVNNGG